MTAEMADNYIKNRLRYLQFTRCGMWNEINRKSKHTDDIKVDNEKNIKEDNDSIIMRKIDWAPGFYAIPGYISLNTLMDDNKNKYTEKGIYSMDISSAITVYILDILSIPHNQNCKVLDLCCCPGGKFQMISELITKESLIVGVDISSNRLNVFKSLLKKWRKQYETYQSANSNIDNGNIPRQLVFECDGTSFSSTSIGHLIYDSFLMSNDFQYLNDRKHINKSSKNHMNKSLKATEQKLTESNNLLMNFDYVLVDAECTHDASYRHLPYITSNSTNSNDIKNNNTNKRANDDQHYHENLFIKSKAFLSHQKYELDTTNNINIPIDNNIIKNNSKNELIILQRKLIHNGFKLLKPGGVLNYSTCSQDIDQNENIVKWLLETEVEHAELISIPKMKNQLFHLHNINYHDSESNDNIKDIDIGDIINNKIDIQSINALKLLNQLNPYDLNYLLNNLNQEKIKDLSNKICTDISATKEPIIYESDELAGTIRLNYKSGMSGHFIAKIKKKEI